jgi:preprotein translocase subunit SecG
MYLFVVALHVVLSVLLILVIILQPGKGGDVGAAFGGGGGSSLFGPRGPTNVLSQATTAVAVGFMCTSITLAYYSNQSLLNNNSGDLEEELREREEARIKKEEAAKAQDAAAEFGGGAAEVPVELVPPPADPSDGAVPVEGGEAPAEQASPEGAPAGEEAGGE